MKARARYFWTFVEIKYLRMRLRYVRWESRFIRSQNPLRWLILYKLDPSILRTHLRIAYLKAENFYLRQLLKRMKNHVQQ